MNIDKSGDLVLLSTISEDAIVSSLQSRYSKDQIYTYIGTGQVLLCVNPFKQINKMYSPATLNSYKNRRPYENAPHVYAIAEKAYKDLQTTHKPQCVLVSGESGAGKTENAKKLMEYITNVACDDDGAAGTGKKAKAKAKRDADAGASIKDKIMRSNVLLEAFGNAKTLRNDNSSRFGKLMEILFDYGGGIVGGRVTSYLLEKIRVTQPKEGERNFHIFYQICEACSRGEYVPFVRVPN
jgi:myosin-1